MERAKREQRPACAEARKRLDADLRSRMQAPGGVHVLTSSEEVCQVTSSAIAVHALHGIRQRQPLPRLKQA